MKDKITFEFQARMWKHSSPKGWYFISLPKMIAKEIKDNSGWMEEGWGRVKISAKIENLEWDTAI